MKRFFSPALAVCIFLLMQVVAGVVTAFAPSHNLAYALLLSNVLTAVLLVALRMVNVPVAFRVRAVDWRHAGWGVAATFLGICSLALMEEMLQLPNLMEEAFADLAHNAIGIVCITIIGPVVEELVFRECVLGHLLREGTNRWTAISVSAVVFGLIHFNPAQIPFATAIGVLFGILYLKSGNIVLTTLIHICNNSLAVWQIWALGDEAADFQMTDYLGGLWPSVLCMTAGLLLCAALLFVFWKQYIMNKN